MSHVSRGNQNPVPHQQRLTPAKHSTILQRLDPHCRFDMIDGQIEPTAKFGLAAVFS